MRVFVPVDVTSPSNELISGAVICETLGWCNINERQERKNLQTSVMDGSIDAYKSPFSAFINDVPRFPTE